MSLYMRPVTVHQLPSYLNQRQGLEFLQLLKENAPSERPRVVLDCSRLKQMDNTTLHILLCCLEEGMKRNGDVRLAGLSVAAERALRRADLLQLFEVFPTSAQAIESYRSPFGVASSPAAYIQERAEGSAA